MCSYDYNKEDKTKFYSDEIFVRIISMTYSQGGIKLLEVWRIRFYCLKPNFL